MSAPKALCRRGMAMLTTVWSRMLINAPKTSTIAITHLYDKPPACRVTCALIAIGNLLSTALPPQDRPSSHGRQNQRSFRALVAARQAMKALRLRRPFLEVG